MPHNETLYIKRDENQQTKYKLYKAYPEKLHVTMQSGLIIDSSGTTKNFLSKCIDVKKKWQTLGHTLMYI